MSRKIQITTRTEVTRVYEVDVERLLADPYFEDADLTSEEALADRFEDWLIDADEDWHAPWARPLSGLGNGEREVYEVNLHPDREAAK